MSSELVGRFAFFVGLLQSLRVIPLESRRQRFPGLLAKQQVLLVLLEPIPCAGGDAAAIDLVERPACGAPRRQDLRLDDLGKLLGRQLAVLMPSVCILVRRQQLLFDGQEIVGMGVEFLEDSNAQ